MVYRRKKVYRRRRKTLARRHPVMKAVAKSVVKRAMSKHIERKERLILMGDKVIRPTVLHWFNPIASIPSGEEASERVGDVINNVRLNLGLSYWHEGNPYGSVEPSWHGSKLRIIVFKTRQQLVATPDSGGWSDSLPAIGLIKGLFLNDFQGAFSEINRHDYTVLYDKTVSSVKQFFTNYASFGVPGQMRFSIPLAKQFRFSSLSQFGTQSNIYVAVVTSAINSDDVDSMGRLQMSGKITWQDA